jgi:heterodisulfide reductase subunit D
MLEKYKAMANGCTRCGMCIVGEAGYVCPVQQHTGGFDQYVARGRNQIAKAIIMNELNYSDELMESTFTCLGCNSCNAQCTKMDPKTGKPDLINESKMTQALRIDLVKAGYGPPDALKAIDGNMAKSYNPFGEPAEKRSAWAEGLNLQKQGDTVYFAGCYASYRNPKISKATVGILQEGGVDVAYLGANEWCCGVPQLWDGNQELAEKLIIHNVEALKASGAKTVVASCAGCYHTLKIEYPEIAGKLPFDVLHSSEVIDGLIKEGKVKMNKEVKGSFTYHDPCHLGRHEKMYDRPRDILSALQGATIVEMPRNKENAWCCGGGSVVAVAFPELAGNIADDRIDEAKATGADAVITSCPLCEDGLNASARKYKMKVYDLSEVVAQAIGLTL